MTAARQAHRDQVAPTGGLVIETFSQAIRSAGLHPPEEIVADGALHRFASAGRRGDDAGWYVLHLDGVPTGRFGCWRTGVEQSWRATLERPLSAAEEVAQEAKTAATRKVREDDKARRQAEAATEAERLWNAARSAADEHSYLVRKGVTAHGIRQHDDGRLIVPVRLGTVLRSLQFIDQNGDKMFLAGGEVKGGYCATGNTSGAKALCIVEGFATGATVHEATGHPVAVAFNAGNLQSVVGELHERYPDLPLIVCGDDDPDVDGNPGRSKATEAAQSVGARLALPERLDDVTDFNDMARHYGIDAVRAAVDAAQTCASPTDTVRAGADEWPEAPDEAAYYGLAGDIVREIEPHTESDPVALLLQVLTGFGSVIGAGSYYEVEACKHPARHFVVMVGASSKARKGSSWQQVSGVLRRVDDAWATERQPSGLSSGEGLIWAVRDPIERQEPVREGGKKSGRITEYQTVETDAGVADKRLMVIEGEYASVLRILGRDGNTLSPTLRRAWDGDRLQTLVKNSPAVATGAHISIVGHITREELLRYLDSTEQGNGFANRFLWAAVRRSKTLPEGGSIESVDFAPLLQRLKQATEHSRACGRLKFDSEARAMWHSVYADLSEGKPGLLGAVTARGEAHVVRLALTYALLDRADVVRTEHLLAALALWEYCERSAAWIFGTATGDAVADRVMRELTLVPEGLTRTEIRDLFKRHQSSERIGRGLALLESAGLVEQVDEVSGGRPVERWRIPARKAI